MYENVISVSKGSNINAMITIKDKKFDVNILGDKRNEKETSALTAYTTAKIINEICIKR